MSRLRVRGDALRLWWTGDPPPAKLQGELAETHTILAQSKEPPFAPDLIDACLVHEGPSSLWPELARESQIPIVVVLRVGEDESLGVERALDAGAFDVIRRPISAAALVSSGLAARRYRIQRTRARYAELALLEAERKNEEVSRRLRWMTAECDRAREDASHSERLATVGTFAAGIAHQINNPLTGVVGFGELLLIREDLSEDMRSDIGRMVVEAKRAAKIIREMLDMTRTCARNEAVDVNELLRKTLAVPQVARTLQKIEVTESLESSLPFIGGDAFRLQQVFQNLLENAAHALEEVQHPKIGVSSCLKGNNVNVRVFDNGAGVEPAARKRLFEAFYTTKTTRKRRGTGLGLAISRSIAREHMGDIFYEPSDLGGACFVVRLPRIEGMSAREPELEPAFQRQSSPKT